MKQALLVFVVLVALSIGGVVSAQGAKTPPRPPKLYITSYYDVDVYRNNRRVSTLKRGVRAQILKTTTKWILVRYWADGQSIVGWIRR